MRRLIALASVGLLLYMVCPSFSLAQEPTIAPPLKKKKPQRKLDLNKKLAIGILSLPEDRSALALNLGLSSNSFRNGFWWRLEAAYL